jgi:hypothetical protein
LSEEDLTGLEAQFTDFPTKEVSTGWATQAPAKRSACAYMVFGRARSTAGTTTLPATTCASAGTSDDKTNVYSTSPKPL